MGLLRGYEELAKKYLSQEYPWVEWMSPPDWARDGHSLPPLSRDKVTLANWNMALTGMMENECPNFWQNKKDWSRIWRRDKQQRKPLGRGPNAYDFNHADFDQAGFFSRFGSQIKRDCLRDIKKELAVIAAANHLGEKSLGNSP